MKTFLKQNWFKIILIIVLVWFVYSLNHNYIRIRVDEYQHSLPGLQGLPGL